MLIVGLTGGIGSGKSTVAKLFAEKGVTIIDTDQLARDVIQAGQPALKQIADQFGPDILLPNGTLDRAKLRKIVFGDEAKRRWLEQLLHPLIRAQMQHLAALSTSPYCIAVIPLLFETEPNPFIQRILVVDTTEELQLARATARDHLSHADIAAMLDVQVSRETRLKLAHDLIHNEGGLEELVPQVNRLHELYKVIGLKTKQ